ncbi:hypothetical protein [Azospirillum tabaci]|uniref:hypothetical protein n=1 Tax=Azospirillum tabaci TaxID=2752310 RepID=UPI001660888F|nr:hypothetical protein [Azospirillum tabaci]
MRSALEDPAVSGPIAEADMDAAELAFVIVFTRAAAIVFTTIGLGLYAAVNFFLP